jgi:hypothetical protein
MYPRLFARCSWLFHRLIMNLLLKKADSQLLIDLVKHPNMWNTETLSEAVVKHDVVFTTTHRSVSENGVRELLD